MKQIKYHHPSHRLPNLRFVCGMRTGIYVMRLRSLGVYAGQNRKWVYYPIVGQTTKTTLLRTRRNLRLWFYEVIHVRRKKFLQMTEEAIVEQ